MSIAWKVDRFGTVLDRDKDFDDVHAIISAKLYAAPCAGQDFNFDLISNLQMLLQFTLASVF